MRKRLSYKDQPTASHDAWSREWLESFKEGAPDMLDMFRSWCLFGQTLPDAIDLYFDIRPALERFGQAKELDEAFGKDLPEEYKDMPYDPRFGFYTIVPDSDDIIQIAAPIIRLDEEIIRTTKLPKFCQPICGDVGFPDWLDIPPYDTWLNKLVVKENPQMENIKLEDI